MAVRMALTTWALYLVLLSAVHGIRWVPVEQQLVLYGSRHEAPAIIKLDWEGDGEWNKLPYIVSDVVSCKGIDNLHDCLDRVKTISKDNGGSGLPPCTLDGKYIGNAASNAPCMVPTQEDAKLGLYYDCTSDISGEKPSGWKGYFGKCITATTAESWYDPIETFEEGELEAQKEAKEKVEAAMSYVGSFCHVLEVNKVGIEVAKNIEVSTGMGIFTSLDVLCFGTGAAAWAVKYEFVQYCVGLKKADKKVDGEGDIKIKPKDGAGEEAMKAAIEMKSNLHKVNGALHTVATVVGRTGMVVKVASVTKSLFVAKGVMVLGLAGTAWWLGIIAAGVGTTALIGRTVAYLTGGLEEDMARLDKDVASLIADRVASDTQSEPVPLPRDQSPYDF